MSLRPPYISILESTVRCGSRTATLTRRDVELFYLLGSAGRCVASTYLADALFPDADAADAENRLHVAVHRFRRRCGEPRVICRDRFGYRTGDGVRCDLDDIEADFRACAGAAGLDDTQLARASDAYARLVASPFVAAAGTSPIGIAIAARVAALLRRLGDCIARDQLRRGRYDSALSFARGAIERDGCDESPLEIFHPRAARRLNARGSDTTVRTP
jgi:hypothetical protein